MTFAYPVYEQQYQGYGDTEAEHASEYVASDYGHQEQIARIGEEGHQDYTHHEDEHVDYYVRIYF